MVNEEISEKTVRIFVRVTELSAREIEKYLSKYLSEQKQKRANKAVEKKPTGKQTVKQLIGQNQGVSSLPVGETGLKDFERIAKKYGVDFAIVKDKTTTPKKYMVFFKARDADAIAQVLAEYTAKQVKKQQKPSVLKAIKKFKEMVANMPKKEHEKKKEKTR